jgi:hypothetical protein
VSPPPRPKPHLHFRLSIASKPEAAHAAAATAKPPTLAQKDVARESQSLEFHATTTVQTIQPIPPSTNPESPSIHSHSRGTPNAQLALLAAPNIEALMPRYQHLFYPRTAHLKAVFERFIHLYVPTPH